MSRWFRWYEGTTEDGKFRAVSRKSRVTVRDVLALWAFMLEDAAHLDHRSVCKRDKDFMSSVLDFDDGVVETILEAMEDVGMISVGPGAITIINWGKRQFEADRDPTAAERQRRRREKVKTGDASVTHASVTRDSRPPETETESESEKKARSSRRSAWSFEEFWRLYPHKIGKRDALKAFDVAKRSEFPFEGVIEALQRYIREKPPDRPWCNPATWLRGGRWDDQPAPQTNGNGNGQAENPHSVVAAGHRLLARVRGFDEPTPSESRIRNGARDPVVRLLPKS